MTTEQWPGQPPVEPSPTWSYATEPVPAEEGRRRRRLPILVAAATVLAVVLGAAAYAGVRLWYGTGAQPEQAAPASVAAFARLDLSPGYGQRLKLNDLIKKFPRESGKDAVDELEASFFESFGVDEEAYRAHIEPWFGKRIGVGLWLDSAKKPYGLVVLNSTDDAKARTGLTEVRRAEGDDFGFVVRDGWVLLVPDQKGAQAAVEAAAAEAQRDTLAASERFRRGADWLPSQQTGLAWADFDRLGSFADDVFGSGAGRAFGSGGLLGLVSVGPGVPASGLKGHLVVGASATDNGVEFRFRAFGMGADIPVDNVRSTVDSLPGDTALAASMRLGDFSELKDALPEELTEEGNPFAALSGVRLTVALAALSDGDEPDLSASAEATSAEQAKELAEALEVFTAGAVSVTTSGNRVELKTKGYAAGGGKLSGQALYREALQGAPERPYAIVYVDVQRLLADTKMADKERREFAAVKAVGAAAGTEDGDPVGLLRVVIR